MFILYDTSLHTQRNETSQCCSAKFRTQVAIGSRSGCLFRAFYVLICPLDSTTTVSSGAVREKAHTLIFSTWKGKKGERRRKTEEERERKAREFRLRKASAPVRDNTGNG